MRLVRAGRPPTEFRTLLRLVAGLAASVLLLVTLPVTPAAANNCRDLKRVKSFHGHFSLHFSISASGTDPDSGGMEDIHLNEDVDGAHGTLSGGALPVPPGAPKNFPREYSFDGSASGGNAGVIDSFENTGTDLSGQATDLNPLKKHSAGALLGINRTSCKYTFGAAFTVKPMFTGDADVNPGRVGWTAAKPNNDVPGSLQLNGSHLLGIYEESCAYRALRHRACLNLETPWLAEFVELKQCGSLDTSHCTLKPDEPLGEARLEWHLTPRYKKTR
jgi:hypothetical protein